MWDDGLGSNNPRCTPTDHSRCWGHRHSVLWKYGAKLAMGAAAGRDSSHHRGYAYLFVGGSAGYTPAYTYTWKQAVADGAGTNTYDPGPPPSSMCHVPIAHRAEAARRVTRRSRRRTARVGEVVCEHTDYVPGIVIRQHPASRHDARASARVFGSPQPPRRSRASTGSRSRTSRRARSRPAPPARAQHFEDALLMWVSMPSWSWPGNETCCRPWRSRPEASCSVPPGPISSSWSPQNANSGQGRSLTSESAGSSESSR